MALELARALETTANWIATAAVCATFGGYGLLADVGSTTTDLIPFAAGRLAAAGAGDAERLIRGELAYAGIVRTPFMALATRAPVAGQWRATMNEHFATTADVFRVPGELDEAADLHPAADNGAKVWHGSARRLLRMVGEDRIEARAVRALARWYRSRLLDRLEQALSQVASRGAIGETAPGPAASSFPNWRRAWRGLARTSPRCCAPRSMTRRCGPAPPNAPRRWR